MQRGFEFVYERPILAMDEFWSSPSIGPQRGGSAARTGQPGDGPSYTGATLLVMKTLVFKGRPSCQRSVAALSVGLALVTFSLAGCSTDKHSGGRLVEGDDGIATVHAPEERQKAPNLVGSRLGGGSLELSKYQGKVVVINVWGSWCAPCRAEARSLVEVARELKGEAQFLGINTREVSQHSGISFERNFKINYPSWYDPAGKKVLEFPKGSLSPQLIPSTVVLDRKGRIAARTLKAVNERDLRKMIDPLLGKRQAK